MKRSQASRQPPGSLPPRTSLPVSLPASASQAPLAIRKLRFPVPKGAEQYHDGMAEERGGSSHGAGDSEQPGITAEDLGDIANRVTEDDIEILDPDEISAPPLVPDDS